DMEEYRDLHLTVELFQRVLDKTEFFDFSAGIVLQSYLPDAFLMQKELTIWAMQRVARGGAPIKIRIVKGANLAMEKVEASLRGWPQAPYITKVDTDANFKRMVAYGCRTEHAKAVHLGIGSHNLFDIAYALLFRVENNIEPYVGFEMLEGMADHLRRVVQAVAGDMLLYCPAATREEFQNAIAYLVRRLDENTAPENFLRYTFSMVPGTPEWETQAAQFSQACFAAETTSSEPRRGQNRFEEPVCKSEAAFFENEPDTDWSLPQNRKWGEFLLQEMQKKHFNNIPLVMGEKAISTEVSLSAGQDPSFPGKVFYQYAIANESHIDLVLETALQGLKAWEEKPLSGRLNLIKEVAHQLRCHRADLIGVMVADTGKTIYEADIEISEAIDFAEYYRRNAAEIQSLEGIHFSAKGPVLVAPPWNFPCSIPTGGIIAALAAGNSVIFKPAPEAVLVGWVLVNILWKAGISKQVLQFFNCEDNPIGSKLIKDHRLAAVILTGATDTAKFLMKLRPGLDLIAETGGKNAMIITCMADRDLAIKDLVQSAFGHAGQKCSACSLAILEAEVYDDPFFRLKLRDAVASLKVGSPWNLATRLNPLIHPPNPSLMRGLTLLEEGEEWLLKPKCDPTNPNLWSPGIKIGVQPYSFIHQTELFGPLLGIMRADTLLHAITLANATSFGLTSGIHTLDEREKLYWMQHIQAGNCYINRGITGAVVQRQPFGGIKESSFGPGAKAGGPNYLLHLMHAEQKSLPSEKGPLNAVIQALSLAVEKYGLREDLLQLWQASLGSYAFFWEHYYSKQHDLSKVLGQDNILKYVTQSQTLRMQDDDADLDILRSIAASLTCGTTFEVSLSGEQESRLLGTVLQGECCRKAKNLAITIETEDDLIDRITTGKIERLRLLSQPSPILQNVLADTACHAIIAPVLANGRIELLNFLREISLSSDYHRYGNLGLREVD
ncbi:MAG: bifunctional proline dehydrogenase/L-glutamate gamma-semialdehyde dehydrogenase, partial [Parachlamydiaceae bacterium]|nr:bifunctional proline dehydrogenase/L-glutamate gamma-semialdehyde dehydrogenase [Parachlamydiaceae bacterium]